MWLSEIAVKRPYSIIMFFLGVFLIGVISLFKLPIDFFPKIEPPVISVIVPYPGATALDVESDVVKYLEDRLSTVSGLDELTSLSKDNLGLVTCKFDWGTDLEVAANDVRDRVDLAKWDIKEHAPDSEEPIIFKFSSSTAPIMAITISSPSSWKQLYRIVDKQVIDKLKRVKGVGTIIVYSELKRQIKVIMNWEKMTALGIPPGLLAKRIYEENLDMPVGRFEKGKREFLIRLKGRFASIEDIKNIIITQRGGKIIYLKDVADVVDDFAEERMKGYSNGKKSIVLIVQKQSGENTVKVCKGIKEALGRIKRRLPSDTEITIPMDASEFILNSIRNLGITIIISGILVVLVTFFFLRTFRSSLIVSLTIPFSLIGAFIFLFLGGYTINVMSLMSLAIAIGMVVDNAIVVLESVVRRIEKGDGDIKRASVFGAKEVAGAIFASSLTTICVFIPLMFVTGFAGIMFKQLGFVVATTIFSSLIVSLTLTPMLCSLWLGRDIKKKAQKRDWMVLLETKYEGLLKVMLENRKKLLALLFVIFIGAMMLFSLIGQDFFPDVDTGDITINFYLEKSANLDETDRVTKEIARIYEEFVPERKSWYAFLGESEKGMAVALGMEEAQNIGEVGAKLVPRSKRKRSVYEIVEVLRREISKIPGIEKLQVYSVTPIKRMLMGGRRKIEVRLSGPDLDILGKLAKELEKKIAQIPGAVDVRSTYKDPKLQVVVKVDRQKAGLLGVTMDSVARTLRMFFYGWTAAKFRSGGDDYDIFLMIPEKARSQIANLRATPVRSIYGTFVRLDNIANVIWDLAPVQIDRKDRERMVTVGCDVSGRALGDVKKDIEQMLSRMEFPAQVSVELGGEVEEQREVFSDLLLLLIVGGVLVYMVLVGQFESLKIPFVIFFSIPFAFVGVVLALLLTGTHFSMVTFMAVIMLVGVVVNNAIVLVDCIGSLRDKGMDIINAVVEAGKTRLRPVLMTSFTTIFGMLPMALGVGEAAEIWQVFGITAIGGLLLSTFLTLILVPMVYVEICRK